MYGGSLDNRCRFLMELITAARKSVGSDFPIVVKLSIDEFIDGAGDRGISIDYQEIGGGRVDGSAAPWASMVPGCLRFPLTMFLEEVSSICPRRSRKS